MRAMTRTPAEPFEPFSTFVQLRQGGGATPIAWTPDFWRTLETRHGDRVVGAKRALVPADFHVDESEMHPEGDELLYLLSGEIDVLLEESAGDGVVRLRGEGCLVRRGVWHRLILKEPRSPVRDAAARHAAAAGTRRRLIGPTVRGSVARSGYWRWCAAARRS
jgi:hypothetical protein